MATTSPTAALHPDSLAWLWYNVSASFCSSSDSPSPHLVNRAEFGYIFLTTFFASALFAFTSFPPSLFIRMTVR
ncbi:hypothetical protein EYF80_026620 [Liparis tanakae]|uniref:Uncharacterized protein n=1 Tax=Liparis tanakae TaxID=230148 RepID=A0A4Z2HBL6_9TELE|nr:hypothetical protein EYF80_026620 [Liparis tanakae]